MPGRKDPTIQEYQIISQTRQGPEGKWLERFHIRRLQVIETSPEIYGNLEKIGKRRYTPEDMAKILEKGTRGLRQLKKLQITGGDLKTGQSRQLSLLEETRPKSAVGKKTHSSNKRSREHEDNPSAQPIKQGRLQNTSATRKSLEPPPMRGQRTNTDSNPTHNRHEKPLQLHNIFGRETGKNVAENGQGKHTNNASRGAAMDSDMKDADNFPSRLPPSEPQYQPSGPSTRLPASSKWLHSR